MNWLIVVVYGQLKGYSVSEEYKSTTFYCCFWCNIESL